MRPLARVRQVVTPQVGRLVGPPRAAGPVAGVPLDPVVPVHVPLQRARLARLRGGERTRLRSRVRGMSRDLKLISRTNEGGERDRDDGMMVDEGG